MEPGKHSNPDIIISSPENDLKPEEDNTGIGRSYECTFCKRGFTNAQALGGHMNIHRKDKDKAKQKKIYNQQQGSSSKNIDHHHGIIKPNENFPNLRYYFIRQTDHDDHHQQQQQQTSYNYYRPAVNNHVYLPWSNPSFETHENNYLNLGIGAVDESGEDDEDGRKNVNKEVEVDLELRLGHA